MLSFPSLSFSPFSLSLFGSAEETAAERFNLLPIVKINGTRFFPCTSISEEGSGFFLFPAAAAAAAESRFPEARQCVAPYPSLGSFFLFLEEEGGGESTGALIRAKRNAPYSAGKRRSFCQTHFSPCAYVYVQARGRIKWYKDIRRVVKYVIIIIIFDDNSFINDDVMGREGGRGGGREMYR